MESKKISPLAIKIEDTILLFRGQKVMLDSVLADLYQVPTRVLVQAMKRNLNRFPTDFVFQLSTVERESLRSQFVISNVVRRTARPSRHASVAIAGSPHVEMGDPEGYERPGPFRVPR